MKKTIGWLVLVLAALGPSGWAQGAGSQVRLVIEDNASLFSEAARESARQRLSQVNAKVNREVHLKTYSGLPENLKAKYDAAGADKAKKAEVWREFATSHLQGERGLVVLICWKPGHVEVAADRAWANAGFDAAKTRNLRESLAKMLNEPAKEKDEAARKKELDKVLSSFTNEVAQLIPVERARAAAPATTGAASNLKTTAQEVEQSNLLGWVCLGVVGLLVVWMIFGAMRGSSMGGAPGAGAPGYGGYGGGGGGFFSNMLGGMFGAAAGMWMYNHFFGGGTPTASAGGWFGGGESQTGEEAGTGDFSGGNQSSGDFGDSSGDSGGGGWFGGGDTGGGDWGGGGGDFGGGDFGGD